MVSPASTGCLLSKWGGPWLGFFDSDVDAKNYAAIILGASRTEWTKGPGGNAVHPKAQLRLYSCPSFVGVKV